MVPGASALALGVYLIFSMSPLAFTTQAEVVGGIPEARHNDPEPSTVPSLAYGPEPEMLISQGTSKSLVSLLSLPQRATVSQVCYLWVTCSLLASEDR